MAANFQKRVQISIHPLQHEIAAIRSLINAVSKQSYDAWMVQLARSRCKWNMPCEKDDFRASIIAPAEQEPDDDVTLLAAHFLPTT